MVLRTVECGRPDDAQKRTQREDDRDPVVCQRSDRGGKRRKKRGSRQRTPSCYRSAAVPLPTPLQFLVLLLSSWISCRRGDAIEFLRAENRVLRSRLGPRRLRFTDAERRLLAEKGKPLGRRLLRRSPRSRRQRPSFAGIARKSRGSTTAAIGGERAAAHRLGRTRSGSS